MQFFSHFYFMIISLPRPQDHFGPFSIKFEFAKKFIFEENIIVDIYVNSCLKYYFLFRLKLKQNRNIKNSGTTAGLIDKDATYKS